MQCNPMSCHRQVLECSLTGKLLLMSTLQNTDFTSLGFRLRMCQDVNAASLREILLQLVNISSLHLFPTNSSPLLALVYNLLLVFSCYFWQQIDHRQWQFAQTNSLCEII